MRFTTLLAAGLLLGLAPVAAAQEGAAKKYNLGKKALAISGYDPVAYFPEGGAEPLKGDKKITAAHAGATYRFSSAAHREVFLADPARYAPAYGGWCAYAMADDDRVDIDPKSFLVRNGQLYLYYDGFWGDTRKKWLKEGEGPLRAKADAAWKEHSGEDEVARRAARRDTDAWALAADGLALAGHDPVALAGEAGAVRGQAKLGLVHRGVRYRFADAANRATFLADPAAYEAAFGGHDAGALAAGRRVAGDARFALRADGRTLLFASAAARDAWQAGDADALAAAAAEHWDEARAASALLPDEKPARRRS